MKSFMKFNFLKKKMLNFNILFNLENISEEEVKDSNENIKKDFNMINRQSTMNPKIPIKYEDEVIQ